MRVQYTIPGWDPSPRALGNLTPAGADFRGKLRRMNEGMPAPPNSILRLDRHPVAPYSMPRPAKPPELEVRDAASERQQWHELLDRVQRALPENGTESDERLNQVQNMVLMLRDMQAREDGILARMQFDTGTL